MDDIANETNGSVFLHEIVSCPNDCNINCTYCEWRKQKIAKLSEGEIKTAKRHFRRIRGLGDCLFGSPPIIGYTGGEPLVHKELIYVLLDTYPDQYVRINTNGLLIDIDIQNLLKSHGKTYMAISLDGNSLAMNQARFKAESQFQTVVKNIDATLKSGICVQIMVTLNLCNIDGFIDYAQWLSTRYTDHIANGSVIMCAHYVNTYGKHPEPTQAQRKTLAEKLEATDIPEIIRSVPWHYQRLAMYLRTQENPGCTAFRWGRWSNFIGKDGREIVTDGNMTSYSCGMYGLSEAAGMNINDPDIVSVFRNHRKSAVDTFIDKKLCGRCITDWNAIDSIINGKVKLTDAQSWFKLFRDPMIVSWLEKNQHRGVSCDSHSNIQ